MGSYALLDSPPELGKSGITVSSIASISVHVLSSANASFRNDFNSICIVGEGMYLLRVHQSVSVSERMTPQKLSGANLESILCNIVSIKLLTEVVT